MTESFPNHEIQRVSRASVRACTKRILGHNFGDGDIVSFDPSSNNAKSQIFGRKDTSYSVIVIGDKHAIFPLCGHQLSSLSNRSVWLDLQSLAGPQGEHRPWWSFSSWTSPG